jgi:hypothetical protein
MIVLMLVSLTLGFEGGYAAPATGFEDISSGVTFSLYSLQRAGFVDIQLGMQITSCRGEHTGYALNTYGVRTWLAKQTWRFSPEISIGVDYVHRTLAQASETGYAFTYGLGMLINIRYNVLRLYPKVFYEGITDFRDSGGFIGIALGVGYEF